MTTEQGEFKGNKTISLLSESDDKENGKFPFTFGIRKAQLIIENIEDIKKFVEENKKEE